MLVVKRIQKVDLLSLSLLLGVVAKAGIVWAVVGCHVGPDQRSANGWERANGVDRLHPGHQSRDTQIHNDDLGQRGPGSGLEVYVVVHVGRVWRDLFGFSPGVGADDGASVSDDAEEGFGGPWSDDDALEVGVAS